MKKIKLLSIAIATSLLVGCATPKVVEQKQLGDEQLSCQGIQDQMNDAKKFEQDARKEKGVTGTNAAALVFFWPAMIATYSNANEAIDAAEDRQEHLHKLYESSGCNKDTVELAAERAEKLAKLMEYREKGLLTDDEYSAAKMKILGIN